MLIFRVIVKPFVIISVESVVLHLVAILTLVECIRFLAFVPVVLGIVFIVLLIFGGIEPFLSLFLTERIVPVILAVLSVVQSVQPVEFLFPVFFAVFSILQPVIFIAVQPVEFAVITIIVPVVLDQ